MHFILTNKGENQDGFDYIAIYWGCGQKWKIEFFLIKPLIKQPPKDVITYVHWGTKGLPGTQFLNWHIMIDRFLGFFLSWKTEQQQSLPKKTKKRLEWIKSKDDYRNNFKISQAKTERILKHERKTEIHFWLVLRKPKCKQKTEICTLLALSSW